MLTGSLVMSFRRFILNSFAGHICAQGVSLSLEPFSAILASGFGSSLPSSAKMCTIAVPCDLLNGLCLRRNFAEAGQFLAQFNVLANNAIAGSDGLVSLLNQCWNPHYSFSKATLEERILSFIVDCLINQENRKVAPPLGDISTCCGTKCLVSYPFSAIQVF